MAVGVLLLGRVLAEGRGGVVVTLLPKEGLYQLSFDEFVIALWEGREVKRHHSLLPKSVGDGFSLEFEDGPDLAAVISFNICAFGKDGTVLHLPLERSLLDQTALGEDGKKRVTLHYGKNFMTMKGRRSKKIAPQDKQPYVCEGFSTR